MEARLRSWWQKIKQHPFVAIGIIVLLIVFLAFALAVYWLGWDWTGFTGYSPPTPQYERGKTLWDRLQLLVIPLMLAIGGFWFNQLQKSRDERSTVQRDKIEHAISRNNQTEAALQAYLDSISELLLEKKLRDSAVEDEVRKIARVRTLTVLLRLDESRKAIVTQFLYESGLIDKDKCIINLNGANLIGAYFIGVNFSKANLIETGFMFAQLSKANLSGADLRRAFLTGADLSEADLTGADLSGANLKDAFGITLEELEKQAKSLKGATMPDGSIHP